MTGSCNSDIQAAAQYLIWAIEEIERIGGEKAAQHARRALEALREVHPSAELKNRRR